MRERGSVEKGFLHSTLVSPFSKTLKTRAGQVKVKENGNRKRDRGRKK